MFDGLFKPKFYTKCKTLVKITKTRVDAVKRKKNSVCKYLRNDIVDLLKNNLDYNAYGRAEGLIEEKRRLSCYESLEQFCICVASNVSLLQKSSGCPDACREAISSLIYAAARVSEVPELRDLRSLFTDKYGNSLEQFVDREFVERFKAEPPSKEMKIQLLREIAKENSIKWDANALEQRLYTPPPALSHHKEIEQTKTKTNEQDKANYPKTTLGNKSSLSFHSRKDSSDNKNSLSFHSRKDSFDNKNGLSFHSRKDSFDDNNKSHFSEDNDSMSTSESSVTTGPEEDLEVKPFYYRFMPAPYNKPKIEKQESLPEKITKSDFMADETDSPTAEKPKPRSVRRRFANPPPIAEDRVETKKPDEEDLYPVKQSKNTRSDSMEKTSGEGFKRMSRRTASWQPKASSIPDFDEVAARVDALSRN